MINFLFLVSTIILKQCDILNAFIDNPQQKRYTVPRRE